MKKRIFVFLVLIIGMIGTVSGAEQLRHSYNGGCPAEDVSGNNNDGTCYNVNTGLGGVFGDAFQFPSQSDSEYVEVSSDSTLNPTQDITIAGYVNFANLDSDDWNHIVTKHGSGYTNQYWVTWNNGFSGRIYDSGGSGYDINTGITPSENTWYHFAMVYNSGTGEQIFYVDGTAEQTNNIGDITPLQTSSTDLRIGAASGGLAQAMEGRVDEVRIYDEPLTQQEIQNLRDVNSLTVNTAPSFDSVSTSPSNWKPGKDTDIFVNATSNSGNTLTAEYRFEYDNGTAVVDWTQMNTGSASDFKFSSAFTPPEDGDYKMVINVSDGEEYTLSNTTRKAEWYIGGNTTYSFSSGGSVGGVLTFGEEDGDVSEWEGDDLSLVNIGSTYLTEGSYSVEIDHDGGGGKNYWYSDFTLDQPSTISVDIYPTSLKYDGTMKIPRFRFKDANGNAVLDADGTLWGTPPSNWDVGEWNTLTYDVDWNAGTYDLILDGQTLVNGKSVGNYNKIQEFRFGNDDTNTHDPYHVLDNLRYSGGTNKAPRIDNLTTEPAPWTAGKSTDLLVNATEPDNDPMSGKYWFGYQNGTPIKDWTSLPTGTITDFKQVDAFNVPETGGDVELRVNISDDNGGWNQSTTKQSLLPVPSVSLESPANDTQVSDPVSLEFTPSCKASGGCAEAGLYINYTGNVTYNWLTDTQSEWNQGSSNGVSIGDSISLKGGGASLFRYDSQLGQDGNGQTIDIDTDTVVTDSGSYTKPADNQIKIETAGWYILSYSTAWQSTSAGSRHIMKNWVTKNGATVTPSENRCYIRLSSGYGDTCSNSGTLLVNANAGDVIRLKGTKDHGATGSTVTTNDVKVNIRQASNPVAQVYDSTGGQDYDGTTVTVNMDSSTKVDSPFTFNSNNDAIEFDESSWYRVYYSVNMHDTSQGDRQNPHTWLRKSDGTEYGNDLDTFSYIRNNGDGDQNHNTAVGFINADSTDDLQVRLEKQYRQGGGSSVTLGDRNWVLVEQVDSDVVAQLRESGGGQGFIEGGQSSVNFDTTDQLGSSYTSGTDYLEVTSEGLYTISYNFAWDDNGVDNRHTVDAWLTKNGNKISGSEQRDYTRGCCGGTNSLSSTVTVDLQSGDRIKLVAAPEGGSPDIEPDGSSLSIMSSAPSGNGTYNSTTFDSGTSAWWSSSQVQATIPAGTNVDVDYSTNKSGAWSYYDSISQLPRSRFARFNASLTTTNTQSPEVDYINISYDEEKEVFRSVNTSSSVQNDTVNVFSHTFANNFSLPQTFNWNVEVTDTDGATGFADGATAFADDNYTVKVTDTADNQTTVSDPRFYKDGQETSNFGLQDVLTTQFNATDKDGRQDVNTSYLSIIDPNGDVKVDNETTLDFYDGFESDASNWVEGTDGDWNVDSGYYKYGYSGNYFEETYVANTELSQRNEGTVSVDFNVKNDAEHFTYLIMRYEDDNNFVAAYCTHFYATCGIEERNNGNRYNTETSRPFSLDNWYNMKFSVQGNQSTLYYNGEELVSRELQYQFGNGQTGLMSSASETWYDNFSVGFPESRSWQINNGFKYEYNYTLPANSTLGGIWTVNTWTEGDRVDKGSDTFTLLTDRPYIQDVVETSTGDNAGMERTLQADVLHSDPGTISKVNVSITHPNGTVMAYPAATNVSTVEGGGARYQYNYTPSKQLDSEGDWSYQFYAEDTAGDTATGSNTFSVNVPSPEIQDVKLYRNGVYTNPFLFNQEYQVRVNVTDEQGGTDISSVELDVTDPSGSTVLSNQGMSAISSITNGYTYGYTTSFGNAVADAGTFTYGVSASDGDYTVQNTGYGTLYWDKPDFFYRQPVTFVDKFDVDRVETAGIQISSQDARLDCNKIYVAMGSGEQVQHELIDDSLSGSTRTCQVKLPVDTTQLGNDYQVYYNNTGTNYNYDISQNISVQETSFDKINALEYFDNADPNNQETFTLSYTKGDPDEDGQIERIATGRTDNQSATNEHAYLRILDEQSNVENTYRWQDGSFSGGYSVKTGNFLSSNPGPEIAVTGYKYDAGLGYYQGALWFFDYDGSTFTRLDQTFWDDGATTQAFALEDVELDTTDATTELVTSGVAQGGTDHAQVVAWDNTTRLGSNQWGNGYERDRIFTLTSGDFDNDGTTEIAGAGTTKLENNNCEGGLDLNATILYYNYDGTNLNREAVHTYKKEDLTEIFGIESADVDEDGTPEVVTSGNWYDCGKSNDVAELRTWEYSSGTTSLKSQTEFPSAGHGSLLTVKWVDVNNDYEKELIASGFQNNGVTDIGFQTILKYNNGYTVLDKEYLEQGGTPIRDADYGDNMVITDTDGDGVNEVTTGGRFGQTPPIKTYQWIREVGGITDTVGSEEQVKLNYPGYSNFQVESPSVYEPGTDTNISVSWSDPDNNFAESVLSLDENTHLTSSYSTVLGAGTYNPSFTGNDTTGLETSTGTQSFTIDKAPVNTDLTFSGAGSTVTNDNLSLKQGNDVDLTVTSEVNITDGSQVDTSTFDLVKNGNNSVGGLTGTTINYTVPTTNLSLGEVNFSSTYNGNQNYLSFTREGTVTITDGEGPEWRDLQDNVTGFAVSGNFVNISAEFRDNDSGLSQAVLGTNESGEWRNITFDSKVVDYYSDGDIAEYRESGFDSNVFEVVSDYSTKGSNSLKGASASAGFTSAISTSGLGLYPSTGQRIQFDIRTSHSDSAETRFIFGAENNSYLSDRYEVQISGSGSKYSIQLFKDNDSGRNNISSSTGDIIPANEWVRYYVKWYNGEIVVENNVTDDRVVAADEEFSSGGIGFGTFPGANSVDSRLDNIQVNNISEDNPLLFDSVTGSYKIADFIWENSSFTGTLGYKVWGEDQNGNWNSTDVGSFTVNSEPVIESISFTDKETGSDLSVSVAASDPDGDLDTVYLNLTDASGNSEVVEGQMTDNGGGSYSYTYGVAGEPSNLGDWSADFRVEDTNGLLDTNTSTFTVSDGIPPEWRNLQVE